VAAKQFGAVPQPGEYHFTSDISARWALRAAGIDFEVPDCDHVFMREKKGQLTVHIDTDTDVQGWAPVKVARELWWAKTIDYRPPTTTTVDGSVRHLICDGKDVGWAVLCDGHWHREPYTHARLIAVSGGEGKPDEILAEYVRKPWTMTNDPFRPEYPGGRVWNESGAQLAYAPQLDPPYDYPTWQRVLGHVGAGLDATIGADLWCEANRIRTGGEYLFHWIASLFQQPATRLPYLFFFSPEQLTGKSSFGEYVGSLMTRGIARADQAITSRSGFNGELEGALLCLLEEVDISASPLAYNRVKDWTTASRLPIHRKYATPYSVPNYTHWVQTANDIRFGPKFEFGDTRIVVCRVPKLEKPIEKVELERLLAREAPAFLGAVMSAPLPVSSDPRLGLPAIVSAEKLTARQLNQTSLDDYLAEHPLTGEVKFSDLYAGFVSTLDSGDQWSKIKTSRELTALGYRVFKGPGNVTFVSSAA
jgi:hypothetical protein